MAITLLDNLDKDELQKQIDHLSEATIPEYWQEHISEKISAIKSLQDNGGKDCFSFVVLTDMHYPANLGKISPVLAKKIMDECDIKYALCLGDTQTRSCHATKELLLTENEAIEEMLSPIRDRLLQTEGNHDGAYGNLNGTTYVYNLTPAELHSAIYRKVGLVGSVHFDEGGSGYYIDDTANKVRYIVLNTQCNDYKLQDDGTVKYPKMWLFRFTQSQFDLMIEALNNIPSNSWNVVVAGHCPLTQEIGDREVMQGVLNAYKNKITYTGNYMGTAEGGAAYTNQIPISTNADGDIYNEKGYKNEYRINSSSQETAYSGAFITGFIPIKPGDTVYINGNYIDAGNENAGSLNIALYKSDKTTFTGGVSMALTEQTDRAFSAFNVNSDGFVTSFTLRKEWEYVGEDWEETAYIRLTLLGSGEECIITVNEEIVDSEHGYDYVSVDCDFSQAKGELVGYFAGHNHTDNSSTVGNVTCITTRSDAKEENTETLKNERIADTITEQSFDIFTVNKAERKIHATKIGAGSDRSISY